MKSNIWKDYFSFTKRERTGVITLVFLILAIAVLPHFFYLFKKPRNQISHKEFQKEIASLEKKADRTGASSTSPTEYVSHYEPAQQSPGLQSELFEFDPNALAKEEWRKLGLKDRTIQTIHNYLSNGGKFRKPQDIAKIYGLKKDDYSRLLPYIRINSDNLLQSQKSDKNNESFFRKKKYSLPIIEINSADTSMLIELPGIGSKLASRISNFRDRLGGFYSVDQISETYGLPDSTFKKIKEFLQCDTSLIKKININSSNAEELKQHPYIRWNLANALINYREQHGHFTSLEGIKALNLITPAQYQKIIPYLTL